jgi:hypothetical protein
MSIWRAKKRDEKLNYTQDNPVKRGPVKHPGDWPWSRPGGGSYLWNDGSCWGWTRCCDGVDIPRGAYIPTRIVGTYAPPAVISQFE